MCGDLEEEDRFEGDLYQRFLVHSRALLSQATNKQGHSQGDEMNLYLDGLFAQLLQGCVFDAEQVAAPNAYRTVAMQSLVLARLAGFLAGHVALNEDPLRKLMEAMMLGYSEAEQAPARDHHGHEHGPGVDPSHSH